MGMIFCAKQCLQCTSIINEGSHDVLDRLETREFGFRGGYHKYVKYKYKYKLLTNR